MEDKWYLQRNGALYLNLYIQPGAKRTELVGLHGEALKIRLAAPPVDGKANAALLLFLSKVFKVPKEAVVLLRGHSSRQKQVQINGAEVSPQAVLEELYPLLDWKKLC